MSKREAMTGVRSYHGSYKNCPGVRPSKLAAGMNKTLNRISERSRWSDEAVTLAVYGTLDPLRKWRGLYADKSPCPTCGMASKQVRMSEKGKARRRELRLLRAGPRPTLRTVSTVLRDRKNPRGMRPALFCIEGLVYIPGWTDGTRWNGWSTPEVKARDAVAFYKRLLAESVGDTSPDDDWWPHTRSMLAEHEAACAADPNCLVDISDGMVWVEASPEEQEVWNDWAELARTLWVRDGEVDGALLVEENDATKAFSRWCPTDDPDTGEELKPNPDDVREMDVMMNCVIEHTKPEAIES